MRITLLTNEYPPYVYGGAGVHLDYLSREVAALDEEKHRVQILCFGDQKAEDANKTVEGVRLSFDFPFQDPRHQKLLDTLFRNMVMTGSIKKTDIVHCHTWYTYLAGCLIKQLSRVPLVITTHSLEPQRPWKEEQLGSAYQVTTWLERLAYENADGVIAVSRSMSEAVHYYYQVPLEKIRIIHNGIDTGQYRPTYDPLILGSYGINPDKPYLLFVGRITRQKGIIHLVNAIKYLAPGIQIVLCAGAPDTEEISREMAEKVKEARGRTENEIVWICQWVPTAHLIPIYSHASVFVCPSVYEPFGIINLEAMACGTPVVASAVGGIPEVVIPGETGLLVPFEPIAPDHSEPREPERFSEELAKAINSLLGSPETLKSMGLKSRERVQEQFSWKSIARQTLEFYTEIIHTQRQLQIAHLTMQN